MSNYSSVNCIGAGLKNCTDIVEGYLLNDIKEGKNLILGFNACEKMYDGIQIGDNCKNFYGVCDVGSKGEHIYCSAWVGTSSFIYYSINLESCSFCFGCIGLKNKSYCILNKQYNKEERYEKVDEIFAQMDIDGTIGQFFPPTMNPFYFNDTAAYLIMGSEGTEPRSTAGQAFTKEEVTAKGYLWRDEPIKVDIPEGMKVVKTSDLDQYEGWRSAEAQGQKERYIDPEILKVIIQDEQGNVYRIVKMEYEFLMKHGLPLPRKHWLERMKENFKIS